MSPLPSRPRIRLRWRLPCVGLFGHPVEGHWLWEADTLPVRTAFQAAVEAGNRAHGDGTHWVEQEKVELLRSSAEAMTIPVRHST